MFHFFWLIHQLNMGAGVIAEVPLPSTLIIVGRTAAGDKIARTATGDKVSRTASQDIVRRRGGGRA